MIEVGSQNISYKMIEGGRKLNGTRCPQLYVHKYNADMEKINRTICTLMNVVVGVEWVGLWRIVSMTYDRTSDISCPLVSNKLVDH